MIKKRETALDRKIEEFGASADDRQAQDSVNPIKAKRDYKAVRVPFNRYEYEQLVQGAELTGRSKLNFIRFAILRYSKELQSGEK